MLAIKLIAELYPDQLIYERYDPGLFALPSAAISPHETT
jgi:hypothetical protein